MVLKIKFITIILDSIKLLQHSTKASLRGSQKKKKKTWVITWLLLIANWRISNHFATNASILTKIYSDTLKFLF